jgi:hypothetical protein
MAGRPSRAPFTRKRSPEPRHTRHAIVCGVVRTPAGDGCRVRIPRVSSAGMCGGGDSSLLPVVPQRVRAGAWRIGFRPRTDGSGVSQYALRVCVCMEVRGSLPAGSPTGWWVPCGKRELVSSNIYKYLLVIIQESGRKLPPLETCWGGGAPRHFRFQLTAPVPAPAAVSAPCPPGSCRLPPSPRRR